jgi:diguanylate cyclase (GGDEF)-like protein
MIMTAAILAASPWLGWWPLAFVLSIMAGFAAADSLMRRLERPELLMFGAWVASALTIAVALTEQASITGEPIGVIVADVDHFKLINDAFGHAAGDMVLKEVAYLLRKQLRAFDLAYRLGGEEFLVLLPGGELNSAAELVECLREAIASGPLEPGVSVSISVGVCASVRGESFDYPAVFARADEALYEAKRDGRDRVCVADDALLAVPA